MCELKVIVNGKRVFENAIYAKENGENVIVKDILGTSMEFKNHKIVEVNIAKEQLMLAELQ